MKLMEEPAPEQSLESSPAKGTEEPPASPQASPPPDDKKSASETGAKKLLKKTRESQFLYVGVFGFVILIIASVIFISLTRQDKNKPSGASASLNSADLTKLTGATTIVGDPKQILDIQSNAVFEGQLLVRGEVNAAADLKVGKDLSVAGVGNFNQIQTTGNFSANGSVTVKGGLSVSGDGSFGKLAASQLTTGGLSLSGDLSIIKHITVAGSLPQASAGAVGSGGTVSIGGSDTAGTVNINTGSAPGSGTLVTVTFAAAFKSTPHVIVTPVGASAGSLNFYITRTANGFSIGTTNPPAAGSSFSFDYIVIG